MYPFVVIKFHFWRDYSKMMMLLLLLLLLLVEADTVLFALEYLLHKQYNLSTFNTVTKS